VSQRQILVDCKQHVSDLIVGYDVKYLDWDAAEIDKGVATALFFFPNTGAGNSNVLLQQFDVRILCIKLNRMPAKLDVHDDISSIVTRFRQSSGLLSNVRYEILAEATGPFYTQNKHSVYAFCEIRVYTQGY